MDNSSFAPEPQVRSGDASARETDRVLKTENVQIERKKLVCTLKENEQGRFIRISEEAGGHRHTIIIPATGIDRLCRVLTDMHSV